MRVWPMAWVPMKPLQLVLAGDPRGVAEILDQLERHGRSTGFRPRRHPRCSRRACAGRRHIRCDSGRRIRSASSSVDDLGAQFDAGAASTSARRCFHLVMDVEALRHLLLLGDLEAQHQLRSPGRAIERHSRWNPAPRCFSDCSIAVISWPIVAGLRRDGISPAMPHMVAMLLSQPATLGQAIPVRLEVPFGDGAT